MAATNVGPDWLEFLPSDDAQQLSAWACVRTRSDPERCELPLCMGHSTPSAQQAIRASAVGFHPAHIAAFPATRANVSMTSRETLDEPHHGYRMLGRTGAVK